MLTNFLFFTLFYKPLWLSHIDILLKITIQKCCPDIHLSNFIIVKGSDGQEYSNRLEHSNWRESFFIVYSLSLAKPFATRRALKVCILLA